MPLTPRTRSVGFPLPSSRSVKVSRRVDQLLHLELAELLADYVPHSIVALELPFNDHESREPYHFRIFFHHFLRDDHVDEAVLVFHQQEHGAFGALRLLANRHQARGGNPFATLQLLQLARVKHSRMTKFLAQMLHWMATDADANREIIEEDQLVPREWTRVVRRLPRRSERQRVANGTHRHPRRAPPIRLPTSERSRPRELQRIGPLQLGALYDIVDRGESVPASGCLQGLESFFAEPADMPPADSQSGPIGILGRLGGALPVAIAHARRQDF